MRSHTVAGWHFYKVSVCSCNLLLKKLGRLPWRGASSSVTAVWPVPPGTACHGYRLAGFLQLPLADGNTAPAPAAERAHSPGLAPPASPQRGAARRPDWRPRTGTPAAGPA